jgi:titin
VLADEIHAAGGARGNSSVGVALHDSAQSNTIGGSVPGARNVIAANTFREVDITSANTTGNIIAGNYLGLDPTGTSAMVGTNTAGVGITNGAQGNTIGGTAAGSRNFIAGHQQYGIFMTDPGTTGNLVRGNTIGLNINGASVPNSFPGVGFFGNAQSNTVGGSAAGASNVISGNTNEGIAIFGLNTTTIKETFSHNSIFNNGGVGIALYDDRGPDFLAGLGASASRCERNS